MVSVDEALNELIFKIWELRRLARQVVPGLKALVINFILFVVFFLLLYVDLPFALTLSLSGQGLCWCLKLQFQEHFMGPWALSKLSRAR